MRSGNNFPVARIALCLLIAVAATACDKAPLLAPTNSTVSVTAPTRTLPLGGSTTITAYVIEQAGTAVQNGTTVRFSTSLGTVDPVETQTHNGAATTTFHAGDLSGVAEVRATSGAAGAGGTTTTPTTTGTTTTTTTATSANVVQITIGAAAVASIVVTASPITVPANGGPVAVIATALDTTGNTLPNIPINFSTTAGTLSASSATTNASGNAQVTLTTTQAATVTAAAGGKTATVNVTVATPNSVSVTLTPNPGIVAQPVTATITPAIGTNNSAPQVTIAWGDGVNESIGTVASSRGVVHTYQTVGTFVVTVTATTQEDVFTTSTVITISDATVGLTASPTSGPFSTTTFAFTITPTTGTTPQGVTIDYGDGTSPLSLGPIASATTVTHRYTSAGSFVVRVTQTNPGGSTSTATVVVTTTP